MASKQPIARLPTDPKARLQIGHRHRSTQITSHRHKLLLLNTRQLPDRLDLLPILETVTDLPCLLSHLYARIRPQPHHAPAERYSGAITPAIFARSSFTQVPAFRQNR